MSDPTRADIQATSEAAVQPNEQACAQVPDAATAELEKLPAEVTLHFNEPIRILKATASDGSGESQELDAAASGADVRLRFANAKLRGTVVLSSAQDGVVRVVSSRDEGRTFTPAIVAFDAAEYPELALSRRAPTRLLALGERLLLFGASVKGNDTYPLLVSDDQGVSFRAP